MIRETKTYILQLMSGILMLLLTLTACSTDDDSQSEKTVLKIYVYTPDHPIVTRGDIGDVSATEAENRINSLHVWVFKHDTGDLVGYVYVTTNENVNSSGTNNGTLLMDVTDPDFIKNKPNVDVYVMANVTSTNCGLTLDGSTERTDLDKAVIKGKFGPSAKVSSVPNDGLPMSGVLKDQPVFGTAPVFGVGSEDNLAKVKLVRAVSKMRFIFCGSCENTAHDVNSITIDKTKFPQQEYLFLNDEYSAVGNPDYPGDERFFPGLRYKVNTAPETGTCTLLNSKTTIPKMQDASRDPAYYEWKSTLDGPAYEDLIAEGLNRGDLHDLGTYYFRESDLQVAGTITYDKKPDNTYKTADFKISDPGFKKGDFGRNHTWIIYAYFNYAKGLNVVTVKVNDWDVVQEDIPHEVYNW